MILFAKKEAICSLSLTKPISLVDSFLKVGECLFLSRFKNILIRRLGIPCTYINWIKDWLNERHSFIEINNHRSRWFSIKKGGPQGSVFTPTLFITYHCDLSIFLSGYTSHCFADDVAIILSGQIGLKYGKQCLDLEKRIKSAIGHPKFNIKFEGLNQNVISWTSDYKYLAYTISSKLG